MTTFKQFFYRQEINESKAIMFPPEIQDKLYDIANKMIPALMHLSKKVKGLTQLENYMTEISI